MTHADVLLKSAELESLRAAWEARLLPAAAAKVADAHAHALKALTDALKATDDGRPSVLRINRSPSYRAANRRLAELWAWLAGPSELSLTGAVRDAREAFYRRAAALWFPLVPEELRSRRTPEPTAAQVKAVRAAMVHGYDARKELEGVFTTAPRTLKAALFQAGLKSTPGHAADDLLKAWETRTAAAVAKAVVGLLGDSVEYADTEAGVDLIHPDHIEIEAVA